MSNPGYLIGFENPKNLIQILVDMAALIEGRVHVVTNDTLNLDPSELPLNGPHLLVDPELLMLQLPLGLTTSHLPTRSVVDGASSLIGPWFGKENSRARHHRARD